MKWLLIKILVPCPIAIIHWEVLLFSFLLYNIVLLFQWSATDLGASAFYEYVINPFYEGSLFLLMCLLRKSFFFFCSFAGCQLKGLPFRFLNSFYQFHVPLDMYHFVFALQCFSTLPSGGLFMKLMKLKPKGPSLA